MARFKIPIPEYQSTSKQLMTSIEDTADDFKHQFLNKIKELDGIDEKDRGVLEGSHAYTSAFKKYSEIHDEVLESFQRMASDGGSNPMNPLVQKDEDFANRFEDIASNKGSSEVTNRIGQINVAIGQDYNSDRLKALLGLAKKYFNSKEYKQITSLLDKGDIMGAFNRMMECDQFLGALDQSPKLADAFISVACGAFEVQDKVNKTWTKGVKAFLNSKGLSALLKKLPQEKALRFFKVVDKFVPEKILKVSGQFLKGMKDIINLDGKGFVKTNLKKLGKLGKGFLGTSLGKCLKSPWAGPIFSGSSSAITDTIKTGDIRKGIGHGVVDGIASIDGIDGVIIGVSLGSKLGLGGAVVGGLAGLGIGMWNQHEQKRHPNFVSDMKKKIDRFINEMDEKTKSGTNDYYVKKENPLGIEHVNVGGMSWFP